MSFSFSFFQHGIYQNFYRTITLYYNSIVLISWPITDQRLIPTSFFFPSQEAIGNRKGSRPRKEESAPILSVSRNIRDMVFHRVIDAQLTQLNFFQSLLIFSPPPIDRDRASLPRSASSRIMQKSAKRKFLKLWLFRDKEGNRIELQVFFKKDERAPCIVFPKQQQQRGN